METATRDRMENAAGRTRRPDDRLVTYLGNGIWQTPYGRAEADRGASVETILNRARENRNG